MELITEVIRESNLEMELKNSKLLIWDIDGVLMHVRDSYRKAIVQTVQYYFSELAGLNLDRNLMTIEDTQVFKLVDRFNNDWKVTYAFVLCFLTRMIHDLNIDGPTSNLEGDFEAMVAELKRLGTTAKNSNPQPVLDLDLGHIAERIDENGGGLEGTERALAGLFGKDLDMAKKFWFQNLIKKVFQELYLGKMLFREKYGEEPVFVNVPGFIENEKPLVDLKTLEKLRGKFIMGVATGRERFEAEFSLRKYEFDRFIPPALIVTSEEVSMGKPSPDSLLKCKRRICEKYELDENEVGAIYVGDSIDDIMASKNAGFFSIGCLSAVLEDGEKEKLRVKFKELGCDLIVDNACEILRAVG